MLSCGRSSVGQGCGLGAGIGMSRVVVVLVLDVGRAGEERSWSLLWLSVGSGPEFAWQFVRTMTVLG